MTAREAAEAFLEGAADPAVPAGTAPLLTALGIGYAILAVADALQRPAAPPEPEDPSPPAWIQQDERERGVEP